MDYSQTPWKDIVIDTRDYTVFKDAYPVTEGHILFVPKEQDWQHLEKCYKAAYAWGYDWTQSGYCDAFNRLLLRGAKHQPLTRMRSTTHRHLLGHSDNWQNFQNTFGKLSEKFRM